MPLESLATSKSKLDEFYNLPLSQLGKLEITTATGNSTPLDRAPATASVITADEIRAMGAKSLDEILETVPGIHVSLSALSRLESVYSIRGIHTGTNPHVLLLMNGVPVQFSVAGGRPISFRYPVSNIARVEIIRGPGSAVYGADAYSGVINVITKDASLIDGVEVGIGVGSFQGRELWLLGKSQWKAWDFTYNLNYQHSDGDDKRVIESDLQTFFDSIPFFDSSASLAPGPLSTRFEILNSHFTATNSYWTINLWGWNSKDSGVGAGAAQALDYNGGDDNDLYLFDTTYKTSDMYDNWNFQVRFSYQYYDTQARLNLLPGGTRVPIGDDGNLNPGSANFVRFSEGLIGNPGGTAEDSQLEFVSIYTGFETHRIRVAQGVRHQSVDTRESKNFGPGVIDGTLSTVSGDLTNVSDSSFVFVKDSSRTTKYISIQDEWHFAPDWDFTVGGRYDNYSDFGVTVNPRLAIVWAAHEKITIKQLYGSAFRAPSFAEQFNENNPVVLGNDQLDPEVISTHELSLNFEASSTFQSALSLFYYKAEDMIEYIAEPSVVGFRAQNARNQRGKGFEWELNWDMTSDMRIRSNYSWSDARDDETGRKIADAPSRQLTLSSNWDISNRWALNMVLNGIEGRKRLENDLRKSIDDYALLDLTIRYKVINSGLGLQFAVRNAGNENAREPSDGANASRGIIVDDYPLAGRSIWAELVYKF